MSAPSVEQIVHLFRINKQLRLRLLEAGLPVETLAVVESLPWASTGPQEVYAVRLNENYNDVEAALNGERTYVRIAMLRARRLAIIKNPGAHPLMLLFNIEPQFLTQPISTRTFWIPFQESEELHDGMSMNPDLYNAQFSRVTVKASDLQHISQNQYFTIAKSNDYITVTAFGDALDQAKVSKTVMPLQHVVSHHQQMITLRINKDRLSDAFEFAASSGNYTLFNFKQHSCRIIDPDHSADHLNKYLESGIFVDVFIEAKKSHISPKKSAQKKPSDTAILTLKCLNALFITPSALKAITQKYQLTILKCSEQSVLVRAKQDIAASIVGKSVCNSLFIFLPIEKEDAAEA